MADNARSKPRKPTATHEPFGRWELRLYVANWEPRSAEAWSNLKKLCEEHLPGLYKIEVVDLLKTPKRSQEDEILALPTVVRRWPQPEKRVIGRLSDAERVSRALELRAARHSGAGKKDGTSRRPRP